MSLDVYLETGDTRNETCPHCGGSGKIDHGREQVYSDNITHNLNKMAMAAGIYEALWRPEEIGISKASQLIKPLRKGLALLESDPKRFRKFDAPHGWGRYENLVEFVQAYIRACIENPDSDVRASR